VIDRPGGQQCNRHKRRHQDESGNDARNSIQHEEGQDPSSHSQAGHRDPKNVVEIEPDEQQVTAQQRSEQRTQRVPRVESTGHRAEVAHLAPQLVEQQRKQRSREADRDREHRERPEQDGQLVIEKLRVQSTEVRANHERPLGTHDERARNPRQGRNREAPEGEREHEHRHHHREGEMRRAQRECADAVQGRLESHHREAREQRDAQPGGDARRRLGRGGRLEIGRNARRAPSQCCENQRRCEIEATHRPDDAVQTQQRNQPESAGQRTREGSERVGAVDPGVNPRRVCDVARERKGQDGNRPTHEDSRRSYQQSR